MISNGLKQPVTNRVLIGNGLNECVTDRFNCCNGLDLTSVTTNSCNGLHIGNGHCGSEPRGRPATLMGNGRQTTTVTDIGACNGC
jgi:hypothetical protein